jgi:hypothetical protein
LAAVAASQEMQEQLGFPTLSRGWVIGTESGTEVMARRHAALALSPRVEASEVKALGRHRWRQAWVEILADSALDRLAIAAGTMPLAQKIALAVLLRRRVGAPYRWIAAQLGLPAGSLRMQAYRASLHGSA